MTILQANPPPAAPKPPARAYNKEVETAAKFLLITRGERLAVQLKLCAKLVAGWDGPGSEPMDRECCIALASLIVHCPPDWSPHWSLVPHPHGALQALLVLPDEIGRASIYARREDGEVRYSLFIRGDEPRYFAWTDPVIAALMLRFPLWLVDAPEE